MQSCESEAGKEAVGEFWQTAVDGRSEGLMIKVCITPYASVVNIAERSSLAVLAAT